MHSRVELLLAEAIFLFTACTPKSPQQPVELSPEKAGCGLVGIDLPDGLVNRAYFAQTQEAASAMFDAFSSTEITSTRDLMRTITHTDGIASPSMFSKADQEEEQRLLNEPFTVLAIRFMPVSEGKTVLLATSGGRVFVTEVNGRNDEWYQNIRLPDNCSPQNATHVQNLVFALAKRNADGVRNFFDPDGALQGVVVPNRFFPEMESELNSGGVPEYAARGIAALAGLQGVPTGELYVPLRDPNGVELRNERNEVIQAPLGARVKRVIGLTQLASGQTLALVEFDGTSGLFDSPELTFAAQNIPLTPVYIDASELHVDLSGIPGVEIETEKVIFATPSAMSELNKALATAQGPTATMTETPLPTNSPEPTASPSPSPSATPPEIHTGFIAPTATAFGSHSEIPDEPNDIQSLILQIGGGVTLASLVIGYYMLRTNRHNYGNG